MLDGSGAGPLKGYTFAVKDLFDVRPLRLVPSIIIQESFGALPLQQVHRIVAHYC